MKVSKVTLLLVIICALLSSEAAAATPPALKAWLEGYLAAMDQLVLLPWRYIYYYTWLILPRFVLCGYFPDLGSLFYPDFTPTSDIAIRKANCNEGVTRFYAWTMYGGGIENAPYAMGQVYGA